MQTDISQEGHWAGGRRFAGLVGLAVRQNVVLLALVFLYYLSALIVSNYTVTTISTVSLSIIVRMMASFIPLFLASMIIWRFSYMAAVDRPAKPIIWLVQDFKKIILVDHLRLLNCFVAFIAILFFTAVFTYVKETIPKLNPFSWDVIFASLDQRIHGGVDPYVILQPVFANPAVMRIVDIAYSAWFLFIYFFTFIACMDRENPIRRNSFLIAFVLTWIFGGSLLATLFSSVGPIYFHDFGFGDQFLPIKSMLMSIHEHRPLLAVEMQTMLLGTGGISAMPSMHLATSWIMAFQAFRYSTKLGWVMVAFAILIQIGSVVLGWHYAIDGYIGFLVAIACWFGGVKLAQIQYRIDRPKKGEKVVSL